MSRFPPTRQVEFQIDLVPGAAPVARGEGHIAKQCTKPKIKRDEMWFNDKVLLVQAQASGQFNKAEEIAILADPGLS
ncbi:hypothetical protein Tco_0242034 [Tanacetum coccineum]